MAERSPTRVRSGPGLAAERGSIPLALLVVMIMAGLTTVIFARTSAEQSSTRADNEFTTVLHAAEVGVEEATFRINNHLVPSSTAEGGGTANGFDYAWTAEKEDGRWVVASTGTGPNDVERVVVAELVDRPIFPHALSTHLGINFRGGNRADSYNSRTQVRCSPPSSLGCFGVVASNGDIDMGSSGSTNNYADRVMVHDWANLDNRENRCLPAGSVFCQSPFREDVDEPLDIRGSVPLVEQLLDGCASFPAWRASDHATGSGNDRHAVLQPTGGQWHDDVGTYSCFSELHFDEHTRLAPSVTADDGLVLVVRDHLKVEGHVKVNCEDCGNSFADNPMPSARRLQIFTLAEDQPASGNNVLAAVQVRQHAKIAAAVYAPNASCGNQQSNAQVEIYGSMACRSVLNQGGWQFHYDEDLLGGLSTGKYFVDRWREE